MSGTVEIEDQIGETAKIVVIHPPGTRIMVMWGDGVPIEHADISVCCDGADNVFAYHCTLEPGHGGQCYSHNKQVRFDRRCHS